MGQHPLWHWIAEPGIPWYLFVMAEYELLFYVMRYIDGGGRITAAGRVIGHNCHNTEDIELERGCGRLPTDSDTSKNDAVLSLDNSTYAKSQEPKQHSTTSAIHIDRASYRPVFMILVAFALSAAVGYFPAINDTFCLSRMINFLPIYMVV